MGHGAGIMGTRLYTLKDVAAMENVTKELLIAIDTMLGLKPDWGEW